jgi:hypothetical protein
VTAELAMVLPTLLVVLAVAGYVLAAQSLSGRCADAARTVAREVARGEQPQPVIDRVLRALPAGSQVQVAPDSGAAPAAGDGGGEGDDGVATVTVRAPLPAPPAVRSLVGDHRVTAVASAPDERGG